VEDAVENDAAEHMIENAVELMVDMEVEFIPRSENTVEYAIKDAVEHMSDEEAKCIPSNACLLEH